MADELYGPQTWLGIFKTHRFFSSMSKLMNQNFREVGLKTLLV